MIKTPCGKNALLIFNVHHAHETLNYNLLLWKEASVDAYK